MKSLWNWTGLYKVIGRVLANSKPTPEDLTSLGPCWSCFWVLWYFCTMFINFSGAGLRSCEVASGCSSSYCLDITSCLDITWCGLDVWPRYPAAGQVQWLMLAILQPMAPSRLLRPSQLWHCFLVDTRVSAAKRCKEMQRDARSGIRFETFGDFGDISSKSFQSRSCQICQCSGCC